MASSSSKKASKCCSMEKKRLVKELEKCNFCTDNHEEFHSCYRAAAWESGKRAKNCMIA
jgi:hypothetical protein